MFFLVLMISFVGTKILLKQTWRHSSDVLREALITLKTRLKATKSKIKPPYPCNENFNEKFMFTNKIFFWKLTKLDFPPLNLIVF